MTASEEEGKDVAHDNTTTAGAATGAG